MKLIKCIQSSVQAVASFFYTRQTQLYSLYRFISHNIQCRVTTAINSSSLWPTSEQPAGLKNYIEKVAVVGVGGRIGKFITKELLKAGKHKITAITRVDSTNRVPAGVDIKRIDYADQASIVEALQSQDALVITMGARAPPEQQTKLIEAAAVANVPWVLPNKWGADISNTGLNKDIPLIGLNARYLEQIELLGKSSWIAVTCGFWYEYSLSFGPHTYGFDFKNSTVTFFDDGNTRINTSTLQQCGRGAAKLLALKVLPDNANDRSPCLAHYRNGSVYISSFRISQGDILDSVLRVTGKKLNDWKIKHEPSTSRYKAGVEAYQKGDFVGLVKLLYSRVFYQDGSGDYEASRGLQNDILGLPKEDLDEHTKIAVQAAQYDFGPGNPSHF